MTKIEYGKCEKLMEEAIRKIKQSQEEYKEAEKYMLLTNYDAVKHEIEQRKADQHYGGASGIVIAHNHPSGDTTPSKEDIESYNRLKEAGKLIGINVLDSVIVGDSYYSFHENGI